MSGPTSGDESLGMNYTDYADYYRAEIDYRREQARRELGPMRMWRRARDRASTKHREGAPNIPFR
jgi:hypothetical protein